ncbi:MAG: site-2 protease family protein [Desulfovibrionaceae bacterium]|nr:site-2 protease family protein [Desulfovibrionaceae bacterium]
MDSVNLTQTLRQLSFALLPVLLGLVLHELAHGYVANIMGDSTAKRQGRLTLNPLPHLSLSGSLFFLVTAFSSAASGSPFILGWAKPVPVNPRNFRNVRAAMILVSLAGAVANLILALIFALFLYHLIQTEPRVDRAGFLFKTCQIGILVNCTLAWFNLLPIPPLDGSKVLAGLMPTPLVRPYLNLERYGMMIIILLLIPGWLGQILRPLTFRTIEIFDSIIKGIF